MSDVKDGGQAFPSEFFETEHGDRVSAFSGSPGMTLRDYFAAQALIGFLADGSQRKVAKAITESAEAALIQDDKAKTAIINELIAEGMYSIADAMLRERSK